jgi:hypothetical protein
VRHHPAPSGYAGRRMNVCDYRPSMSRSDQELRCRRCHLPVRISAASFDVFEQMHYVCFHYEFEHGDLDVDEECGAGGCPSAVVNARPMRRPQNLVMLRDLTQGLADRLTSEQQTWTQEYLDAGEWGLTLEMLADWLSEDSLPITASERQIFQNLSELMSRSERVMGALDTCPSRDSA